MRETSPSWVIHGRDGAGPWKEPRAAESFCCSLECSLSCWQQEGCALLGSCSKNTSLNWKEINSAAETAWNCSWARGNVTGDTLVLCGEVRLEKRQRRKWGWDESG